VLQTLLKESLLYAFWGVGPLQSCGQALHNRLPWVLHPEGRAFRVRYFPKPFQRERPHVRWLFQACRRDLLDGSADDYLNAALLREKMPCLKRMALGGYRGMARSALPSFTNTNNASIVTGAPHPFTGSRGTSFSIRTLAKK